MWDSFCLVQGGSDAGRGAGLGSAQLVPSVTQGELGRPCREPARPAEAFELGEHGNEGVVRGLVHEGVELPARHLAELVTRSAQLEARAAQQQLVQLGERFVANARWALESGDPCPRTVVGSTAGDERSPALSSRNVLEHR